MKKIKILCFILFLFMILLTLTGCSNKNDDKNKEKAMSEVKYLESKLTTLLNSMNNIKYENYKVTTTKIEEGSTSNSSESNNSSDSNSSSSDSNSQGQASKGGGEEQNNTGTEDQNNQMQSNKNKYTLEKTNTLSNSTNTIDWNYIKNEVEEIYSSVPNITLDLYSQNVNQDEILSFNNELDNLTVAVKEENKEKALIHLSNLYGYLPKYLNTVSTDTTYTNLTRTKSNVVSAYSIIDTGDWNKVSEYIRKAIEDYSGLLNNIDNNSKSYTINKGYILLNELQNAAKLHDKEIFLIKYENLLEEFNSI